MSNDSARLYFDKALWFILQAQDNDGLEQNDHSVADIVLKHPALNSMFFLHCLIYFTNCWTLGVPCDENGVFLALNTPLPPYTAWSPNDWSLYCNCINFETTNLLFRKNKMPHTKVNQLMEIWAASTLQVTGGESMDAPYNRADGILKTIDATSLGDVQ